MSDQKLFDAKRMSNINSVCVKGNTGADYRIHYFRKNTSERKGLIVLRAPSVSVSANADYLRQVAGVRNGKD